MIKIKILQIGILLFLFITGCGSDSDSSTPPPLGSGEYGGDGSTCEEYWNVLYDLSMPIKGFQFNVEGVTILSAAGGVAEAAGFMVTAGSTVVIGFSLTGATIPAGAGILTVLEFEVDAGTACLADLVISDVSGNALDVEIINCNTIKSSR